MKTWYLIQYLPNPLAREATNVGVVVHDETDNWAVRMVFVSSGGGVDPQLFRPIGGSLSIEEYEGWVGYYRRAILEGRWEQATTLHLRQPVNFQVLVGGNLMDDSQTVKAAARELFAATVARKLREPRPHLSHIKNRTLALLAQIGIDVEENIQLDAAWGDAREKLTFALAAGDTIIEPLALAGPHGALFARDFHARVNALQTKRNFLVTYSETGVADATLAPIRAVATTVSIDAPDSAAQLRAAVEGL